MAKERATKALLKKQLTLNAGNLDISEDRIKLSEEQKQYEELLREKSIIKMKITEWIKEFEEREGRKITTADKEPIRHFYLEYKQINQRLRELKQILDEMRINDSVLSKFPHSFSSIFFY